MADPKSAADNPTLEEWEKYLLDTIEKRLASLRRHLEDLCQNLS